MDIKSYPCSIILKLNDLFYFENCNCFKSTDMATEMSRAATYLSYTGNTVYTLGTAAGAFGVLYAVNRISGHGIKGLEGIPSLIHTLTRPSRLQEATTTTEQPTPSEQPTPTNTSPGLKNVLKQEFLAYCAISGLIGLGAICTFAGKKMVAPETLDWVNQFYK
jgi:hypothetical protein